MHARALVHRVKILECVTFYCAAPPLCRPPFIPGYRGKEGRKRDTISRVLRSDGASAPANGRPPSSCSSPLHEYQPPAQCFTLNAVLVVRSRAIRLLVLANESPGFCSFFFFASTIDGWLDLAFTILRKDHNVVQGK